MFSYYQTIFESAVKSWRSPCPSSQDQPTLHLCNHLHKYES